MMPHVKRRNFNIHHLYYGPLENRGICLEATEGLRNRVSESIVYECYNKPASYHRVQDSAEIHHTPQGPIISITRTEPCQNHDSRVTTKNRTYFICLSDVVACLITLLLDEPQKFPLQPLKISLHNGHDDNVEG